MKAISKKLLSLLVVIAMVLSMVPFGGLSIFAVETKAATEDEIATVGDEIEYGSNNWPTEAQTSLDGKTVAEHIAEVKTTIQDLDPATVVAQQNVACPMCGRTVEAWTKVSATGAAPTITSSSTDSHPHVYFEGEHTYAWTNIAAIQGMDGATICIVLVDADIENDGRIQIGGTNGTVNIMGNGTLRSNGTKCKYGIFTMNGSSPTLNLYGGTYIYTATPSEAKYPAIAAVNSGCTVNIYDGVVIGQESIPETKVAHSNVYTAGTFNMYGGTIRNGVNGFDNASGNVHMASGTFNMYDGTISGGTLVEDQTTVGSNIRVGAGTFNMYGGTISGGETRNAGGGGQVYISGGGTGNLLGGIIENGDATNGYGGNVQGWTGTVNIDGTVLIRNGKANVAGGNIYIANSNFDVNIKGGKIEGGEAPNGGSIYLKENNTNGGEMVISGGIIDGGRATSGAGGNIYQKVGSALTIQGGTITKGVASSAGGNIRTEGTLEISGGTITSGSSGASHGGNISANGGAHLTVSGGVIANGNSGAYQGGNIHVWNSQLDISGGYIYGGTNTSSSSANENIWVQGDATGGALSTPMPVVNISGGHINGDCRVSGTVTLSGNPVITRTLTVPTLPEEEGDTKTVTAADGGFTILYPITEGYNSTTVNVNGLTAGENGAKIEIWNAQSALAAITVASENAQTLIDGGNIVADRSGYRAICKENIIYLEEYVEEKQPSEDEFDPWNYDGKAYCPHCDEIVAGWLPFASDATTDLSSAMTDSAVTSIKRINTVDDGKHYHVYLKDDHTFNGNFGALTSGTSVCLHTNGKTLAYQGRLFGSDSNLYIMGGGTVTSDGTNTWGDATLTWSGGELVIYDATVKSTAANGNPALVLRTTAKVTMKNGAVIDGNGVARCVKFESTSTAKAALTMEAGSTIQNGFYSAEASGRAAVGATESGIWASSSYNGGGNVWLQHGTLTINGGKILNGVAGTGLDTESVSKDSYGGNIYNFGGTLEINEGSLISGGKATSSWTGGNIYTNASAKITMNGGEIKGGVRISTDNETVINTATGANIFNNGATFTLNGGTISNEGITATEGSNIKLNTNGVMVINSGTVTTGIATNGGNIILTAETAKLTMNGGEILDGYASSLGGNIRNSSGTLELNKGLISGGKAISQGGNIYHAGASFTQGAEHVISGGNVLGSDSVNPKGGNIFLAKSATINGTVKNGNSIYSGGNAHISGTGTTLTIGSTGQFLGLKEGSTVKFGGNIATEGSSVLTVEGTVADGHSVMRGGNIDIMGAGILNLAEGSCVKDGVSVYTSGTGSVGNIFAQNADAVININGGSITGGQGYSCGNLSVTKATVNMTAGEISGGSNTRTTHADNVYILTGAVMNMSGGTVYGVDNAEYAGSAMRLSGGTLNLMGTAQVIRADGVAKHVIQCEPTGLIQIDNGWTGKAVVNFNSSYSVGDVIDPAETDTTATGDYYAVCGSFAEDGTFTRGGSYSGLLIWGQSYNPGIIGIDGLCYLAGYAVADAADGSETWYATATEAINAIEKETEYLKAGASVEVAEGKTVYIDALADISVTGEGTAYAIDVANAGFTTASTGKITGEIVENDATFNGTRYIRIEDGTAHAIEMGIKSISLRPDEKTPGLYYKAEYKCDTTLAAAIEAYGVVLSVNDMPGDDFAEATDTQFTVREDFETNYNTETHAVSANSGSVFGIMKLDGRTAEQNAKYGDMKIYANAYILVDGTAVYVADTTNGGKQGHDSENTETYDANFGGVAYSLHDVMDVINAKWTTLGLNETQRGAVLTMLDNFKDFGMADWATSNITA